MLELNRPIQVMAGETASVVSRPPQLPEPLEKLNSCTVEIRTPSTNGFEAATDSPVTIQSVDTTLTAAAAEGARSISVDIFGSDANFTVGRTYVLGTYDADALSSRDARPLIAEVVETDWDGASTLTVDLAEPLPRALPSGSRIHGWSVAVALTTSHTADRGAFDLRFEATTPTGQRFKWWERGYIVPWPVYPPLNAGNIGQHLPEVWRRRSAEDGDLAEAIAAAWTDILLPALEQEVDFWTIRETSRLAPVHAAAVALHQVIGDERAPPDFVEQTRRLYRERLQLALNAKRFWADVDEDGAVDDDNDFTHTEFTR